MSRIGPNGEIYLTQPTKEQTFREVREPGLEQMATSGGGAREVATLLRQLADSIERHAAYLMTDAGMPPWSHRPSEPITTPLCSVGLRLSVEDPPRHGRFGEDYIYNSYRLTAIARLGFE